MTLEGAIEASRRAEKNAKPIYGYESNNYFLFNMGDSSGQLIGNNAMMVVDKRTGKVEWKPRSAFPLEDGGSLIREFDLSN